MNHNTHVVASRLDSSRSKTRSIIGGRTILTLLLLGCITSSIVKADHCVDHPIYCQILKVQPKVDKRLAMQASNILHVAAKHYGYDPMISVAIGMQETGWRPQDRYRTLASGETVVTDIGLMQFYVPTVLDFDLDIDRLRNDLNYHIWQHAKLLKRKMNICKRYGWAEGEEWSCWHIYPIDEERSALREDYARLVKRYLL